MEESAITATMVHTFNLILEDGDVEKNPAPGLTSAPKCSTCNKTVCCNQKRRTKCVETTHARYTDINLQNMQSRVTTSWICPYCAHLDLSFENTSNDLIKNVITHRLHTSIHEVICQPLQSLH